MTTPGTYYTGRLPLPEQIVRGADTSISLTVYRDGALVSVASATVSVYDGGGTTIVSSAAATVAADVMSYTVTGATTTGRALSDDWRIEWTVTLTAGPVEVFKSDAHLVRTLLRPVITDADLYRRVTGLDASGSNALTSRDDYQVFLDEAWVELMGRLIEKGNRPALVGSPSALRAPHLYLTLALVFEDMAARNPDSYSERAAMYRRQYEGALQRLTFRYPEDETGDTPSGQRGGSRGPMFLCQVGRRW